jgi:hypothetical protein
LLSAIVTWQAPLQLASSSVTSYVMTSNPDFIAGRWCEYYCNVWLGGFLCNRLR